MLVHKEYVETKLATKFSEFNIRVYPNHIGQETFVLWTDNLDLKKPVLVRVHSECITGDVLGSLRCDCGKQLSKALHLISEEGGILIYLRQEGRGIGLFEKIKSYQLQSQGYDTFKANVLLGHKPDQRSYEMVKTILADLNVKRIRLLTNNPSKMSEIAKLGIEIVERVPLISRSNKYNKAYLETKRKKFQHFFSKSTQFYLYQFQIGQLEQIDPLIDFIKDKKKDPLLKIGVGISVNPLTLKNEQDIKRISSVIQSFEHHKELVPIIHFSCSNSKDILKDLHKVKNLWPSIHRVQLNDLENIELHQFRKLCELFCVDIPLSDETFEIIYNQQFRDIIQKNKGLIILDNSKGKGLQESKEAFIRKIDILLDYGLNNIGLCGGFGPDQLETYFELRRYYRINFSIDAETHLKTNKVTDIEKIQLYLLQLLRFDDPKHEGIEQTRKFLEEHRRTDWDRTIINGIEFAIHPKVFHAGHFPSTAWFASELSSLIKKDSSFCEIGCGSGVISCLLALAHPKLKITATDINPHASENTQLNAQNLGVLPRMTVLTGDVLDSILPNVTFDTIFWALPFGFLDPGKPINLEEAQVFDPGYRAIRKFFQTAKNHLKSNGRILIGFSPDLGHLSLIEELAKASNIRLTKVAEKVMREEVDIKFEILEGNLANN